MVACSSATVALVPSGKPSGRKLADYYAVGWGVGVTRPLKYINI